MSSWDAWLRQLLRRSPGVRVAAGEHLGVGTGTAAVPRTADSAASAAAADVPVLAGTAADSRGRGGRAAAAGGVAV